MTQQESTGPDNPAPDAPHTPPLEAGGQEAPASTPSTDIESTRPGSHTAGLGAPSSLSAAIPTSPGQQTRRARFGARWQTSVPLRAATAVLVAVLIGGVGFTAASVLNGDDGHHVRHELSANHPFWQDREGWIHRGEHGGIQRVHLSSALDGSPSATPAPAPAN